MNPTLRLAKAIAVCLKYYNIVQSSAPFPPFEVERRRWRLAKSQMFDAFDVFYGLEQERLASLGVAWIHIINPTHLKLGEYDLATGKLNITSMDPESGGFFEAMTNLLLAAAWTNG